MTADLFPGRSALSALGGENDDWVEGYRKGFQFGSEDDKTTLTLYQSAYRAMLELSASSLSLTPQGWKDLENRRRAALDRLRGLREGFKDSGGGTL